MGQRVSPHTGPPAIPSPIVKPPEDPDPWKWPLTFGVNLAGWRDYVGSIPVQLWCTLPGCVVDPLLA